MADVTRTTTPLASLASASRSLQHSVTGRFVTVALFIGVLWAAASFLARTAHDQRVTRAEAAATRAAGAAAEGRRDDAVALFREAVGLQPRQADYRLSLAKALVAAGRPAEAEPYVQEVLRQQPVNGEANLVLARIYDQAGSREDAERTYYQAIYGRWPAAAQPLRMRARLELVDHYRRLGERNHLRAALLELSNAFPGDRELQLQAGRDLLSEGFVDDAARQLRVVTDRFANAGDARVLLARAEFARRNYVDAYAAAGRVVADDPRNAEMAAMRVLTARILALDPDQRRLSARERLSRLRVLLAAVREHLATCDAGAEVASLRPLVDQWLTRQSTDAELGRTLLEASARQVPASCLPSPHASAVGRLMADLGSEATR
jgi:thioredoxin-like negative regulator of GroEL